MRLCLRTSAILAISLLLPAMAHAQIIVVPNPCPIPQLPCIAGGFMGITKFFADFLFPALRILFVGLAVVMFSAYAIRLMTEGEDQNTINEVKSAYAYGIAAAVLVGISAIIVDAVGQGTGQDLIKPAPLNGIIANIILFMRMMLSVAVSALFVYQGIRLILLRGDEGELQQQRKRFVYGLIGVAIVFLAEALMNSVLPGANSGITAVEIIGIVNFLLSILGGLCVLAILAGGVFLVFATNDALVDRAKKTIFTAVIAIVVVLSMGILLSYVSSL
jgi:hypothetical protein